MKVCLYLSVLCNKLVLSAWCAYIQVLPTISLYALIKRYALKIGSSLLEVILYCLPLQTEETRVVLHFHYTKWPDFGVPKTADDFLKFLDSVRASGVLDEDVGPCVVHCR